MQERNTYKINAEGEVRAYGGLNVLYVGDFFQLAPPEGVPLTTVPDWLLQSRVESKPQTKNGRLGNGLELFWGGYPWGVQDMTELVTPHRCKDLWYNEVVNEIRAMSLSVDNHAFLHGMPTTVPGSWVAGKTERGRKRCRKLVRTWAKERGRSVPWEVMQQAECDYCKEQRKQRRWIRAHD